VSVVITAGAAVLLTLGLLTLAGHVFEVSAYARNVVTGLGLGLGVDYSLLLVSRLREEAAGEGYGAPAMRRALASAGATIKVSAVIVAGAGLCLQAFPQPLLRSIGLAIVFVAASACFAALVPLTAGLLLLGDRVDRLRVRAGGREAAGRARRGWWYVHARRVQAHPWRFAPSSLARRCSRSPPLRSACGSPRSMRAWCPPTRPIGGSPKPSRATFHHQAASPPSTRSSAPHPRAQPGTPRSPTPSACAACQGPCASPHRRRSPRACGAST
jgi:hypothetical protein